MPSFHRLHPSRWALAGVVGLASLAVAGPAHASTVALFGNSSYVDTTTDDGGEYENLRGSFPAFGDTVTPFTSIQASDIKAVTAGKDVLAFPEQEPTEDVPPTNPDTGETSLADDLSPSAKAVIRDYVAGGGTLIMFTDYSSVLNSVFGYSLVEGSTSDLFERQPTAAGTPFASAAASLPDNDGSTAIETASLPAAATDLYSGTSGGTPEEQAANRSSAVFSTKYGRGTIVYLGWDWFGSTRPADPTFTDGDQQDGGWQDVLRRAANIKPTPIVVPPVTPPVDPPAPTPTPTPVPPVAPVTDVTAPVLTSSKLARRSVRVRVSEAATVTFVVQQRKRLVTRVHGKRKVRISYRTVKKLTGTSGGAQVVKVALKKALPHGRYRLVVSARDAAGNAARTARSAAKL